MADMILDSLSRRFEIFFYIVKNHETLYEELMREFAVSRRTIARDIQFISDEIAVLDMYRLLDNGKFDEIEMQKSRFMETLHTILQVYARSRFRKEIEENQKE